MALEERIDNIGKKAKAVRRKRKGDDDVDVSFRVIDDPLRSSRVLEDRRLLPR